jgi:hypothetical protein
MTTPPDQTGCSTAASSEPRVMNILFPALAIGLTGCVIACASSGSKSGDGPGPSEYQRGMVAESLGLSRETDTTYTRRMLDLIRRSRLVSTDSLTKLYAAFMNTPRPEQWRLSRAIVCEEALLSMKHGATPANRAFRRMQDSLKRSGLDLDRVEELLLTAPGAPKALDPPMTIGLSTCGETMFLFPRVPDSLGSEPYPARFQVKPRAPIPSRRSDRG